MKQEQILVQFNENRSWCAVVEWLGEDAAIVEWDQPGAGLVRGGVDRGDLHPETGEQIWDWNGDFEPVEEE